MQTYVIPFYVIFMCHVPMPLILFHEVSSDFDDYIHIEYKYMNLGLNIATSIYTRKKLDKVVNDTSFNATIDKR